MIIHCTTTANSPSRVSSKSNLIDRFPYPSSSNRPTGKLDILVRRANYYSNRKVIVLENNNLIEKELSLPSGKILDKIEGSNLIVDRARTQMSHLIVGDGTNIRFINRMNFGTGGHAAGDPSTPVNPSTTDTQLETSILTKPLASISWPSALSVLIIAFVLEGEANGFTLTEAGLLCGDNTLDARRTYAGLTKTSDFTFEFAWTINF